MVLLRAPTLTVLLALAGDANAFYEKSSGVLMLGPESFRKEILDTQYASVVEFFAPWCGHCQKLKPAYQKVAKSLRGLAKVAAVDCDEDRNKDLCAGYGVQGFPTLKVFKPGDRKGKATVSNYEGPRTASDIVNHVVELIPNHVKRVTEVNLDSFLSTRNESAKAILFTNKGTTTPLWKALAIDYLGVISFAQIRDKEKTIVEAFGIQKYPTILLLPGGDAEGLTYPGSSFSKDELLKFFRETVPLPEPLPEKKPKEKKPKEKKKEKKTKEKETQATESEESTSTGEAQSETSEAEKKPTPKKTPSIPTLGDQQALTAACLTPKSKTCILAIIPSAPSAILTDVYTKLLIRSPPGAFRVYALPTESPHAISLAEKLHLVGDGTKLFAINARRNWIKKFSGNVDSGEEVLAWLDATRLGDGVRERLPQGVVEKELEIEVEEIHEEL